jgi:signal transduction histidine kinase
VKIRNRITLWITGAGLLAALLFSIIISYELIEQPFELLDSELDSHAYTILAGLSPQNDTLPSSLNTSMLHSLGQLYWFKVFDQQQNIVYASSMAQSVDIPLKEKNKRYTVHTKVPLEVATLDRDKSNNVTFRVRVSTIPFGGQEYRVQIARPMEKLWEEIVELVVAIGVGLVFFTLTLVLLGYFVAGKILQPIIEINTLAQEINDKTLDKRIPLGKTHDELHALSSSLNKMFDRLQFSFKRQKEFIANASHELKTPIAMQRLFWGEAVQRDDLSENFRAKLVVQAGITMRMNQLVKNLLDLSALEQHETLDLKPIDLTKLVVSVFGEFAEIIQAASIYLSLDIGEDVLLRADREKMRRMLINLIDNSIKYNLDREGEIRFSLSKRDNEVQMDISNTGQTIPGDELQKVFNQFYRVEKSRSTALGGSGLGLTIVKRVVELHCGTIEIVSEPDNWTRIQIVFPAVSLS